MSSSLTAASSPQKRQTGPGNGDNENDVLSQLTRHIISVNPRVLFKLQIGCSPSLVTFDTTVKRMEAHLIQADSKSNMRTKHVRSLSVHYHKSTHWRRGLWVPYGGALWNYLTING